MESDIIQPSGKECECGCNRCDPVVNPTCTKTWIRSVKRKLDELEEDRYKFNIPGLLLPDVARVEIKDECGALHEMVTNQQQSIRDLSVELEEERNASSSAANEAMSMIIRLQREKAEIEMEARQFKRFAEHKTSHDQQEIAALEELLYKREQTIQSLTCEVQAYKYRMMSYGLTESEAEGEKGLITRTNSMVTTSENQFGQFFDYPPLKCHTNEQQTYPESETETIDIEKYTFTETPCSLKEIEQRINQLENSPRHPPVLEQRINHLENSPRYPPVLEQRINQLENSPRHPQVLEQRINQLENSPRHPQVLEHRINQLENSPRHPQVLEQRINQLENSPRHPQVLEQRINQLENSPRHPQVLEQRINQLENSPRHQPVLEKVIVGQTPRKNKPASHFSLDSAGSFYATIKEEDNLCFKKVDTVSEYESEMSDRIYTVDSIHYDTKPNKETYDDIMSSPKDSMCHSEVHSEIQNTEVMKLYARLHALEADRESMKQAIINMRTDKAQLVLLKEIAQNLCKDMSPQTRKIPVKKHSVFGNFGQSIASLILWRKKTSQSKYMFGMTASNPGMMVLFDKGYQVGQWRCVSRTQL